jgi:preprotein translocase subunit SecE
MWVRILLPLQIRWLRTGVLLTGRGFRFQLFSVNKKITMAKIATYVKESWKELTTKVTWPTWDKLQSSAILVMVTTLILAVIIWLIDLIIRTIMTGIYSL